MHFFIPINFLSTLGCLAILLGGYLTKQSLTSPAKLILLLAFSDLLYHVSNLIIYHLKSGDEFFCNFFLVINLVSSFASLLWSSALAILAYISLKTTRRSSLLRQFKLIIMGFMLISILYALIPVFEITDIRYTSGDPGEDCVIIDIDDDDESEHLQIRLFLSLFPLLVIISLIITISSYVNSILLVKRLSKEFGYTVNFATKRLLVYPITQLLIYVPISLFSIFGLFRIFDEAFEFMDIISPYTMNFAGFLNFIVYGTQVIYNRRKKKRYSMSPDDESMDLLEESKVEDNDISRKLTDHIEDSLIEALHH